MKNFKEWEQMSEGFKYHLDNNLGLENSIYRIGSEAYNELFEEAVYWDKNNIILSNPSAWMSKNLKIGTKAVYFEKEGGKRVKKQVVLDIPKKGGRKKYYVYHDSGKKTETGEIIAKKIEWGDPKLDVKNHIPERAKSFWARHKCDTKEKMDPSKAGFWSCYVGLFYKELDLESDAPW